MTLSLSCQMWRSGCVEFGKLTDNCFKRYIFWYPFITVVVIYWKLIFHKLVWCYRCYSIVLRVCLWMILDDFLNGQHLSKTGTNVCVQLYMAHGVDWWRWSLLWARISESWKHCYLLWGHPCHITGLSRPTFAGVLETKNFFTSNCVSILVAKYFCFRFNILVFYSKLVISSFLYLFICLFKNWWRLYLCVCKYTYSWICLFIIFIYIQFLYS